MYYKYSHQNSLDPGTLWICSSSCACVETLEKTRLRTSVYRQKNPGQRAGSCFFLLFSVIFGLFLLFFLPLSHYRRFTSRCDATTSRCGTSDDHRLVPDRYALRPDFAHPSTLRTRISIAINIHRSRSSCGIARLFACITRGKSV